MPGHMCSDFSVRRTVINLLNEEGSILTVFGNNVSEKSPFVRETYFHLFYDSMGIESVSLSKNGQES